MSAGRLNACDMGTSSGLSVRITILAAAALYHIVYPGPLSGSFLNYFQLPSIQMIFLL